MSPFRRSRLVGVLAALSFTLALAAASARAVLVTPQNTGFLAVAVGNITLQTLPTAHTIVCSGQTIGDKVPYPFSNSGSVGSVGSVISDMNGDSTSISNLLVGCVIDGISTLSGGVTATWSFSWNLLPGNVRAAAVALPRRGIDLSDVNCSITADTFAVQSMTGTWTNASPAATLRFRDQMLLVTTSSPCNYGPIQAVLYSGTFDVAAVGGPVAVN